MSLLSSVAERRELVGSRRATRAGTFCRCLNATGFSIAGSDERQYCAPGVDLPIASVMRSKYGTYPEYHTSLDDLSFITPTGLHGGFTALRRCIEVLELDRRFETRVLCEPQMGKRGLYSTLGTAQVNDAVRTRMNILAYSDGKHSVLDIAEILCRPAWELAPYVSELVDHGLIRSVDPF